MANSHEVALKYLLNLKEYSFYESYNVGTGKGTSVLQLIKTFEKVNKVMEGRPHIVDSILNNDIDLIINTTEGSQSIRDSASIRQSALRNKIFCTTTMFGAFAIIDALQGSENDWTYTTLQELNK